MKFILNSKVASITTAEELTMLAIYRLDPRAYAPNIHALLEEAFYQKFSIGRIYLNLGNLESKGFILGYQSPITQKQGGKSARYYTVTQRGQAALLTIEEVREKLKGATL